MHSIRPLNIPWLALALLLITGGLVYLLGPILTPFLAGALLAAAPPLVIYAFLMDYYIAGLTSGATKG